MKQDARKILRKQNERDIDRLLREAKEKERPAREAALIEHIEELEERYPNRFGLGCAAAAAFSVAFWILIIWLASR